MSPDTLVGTTGSLLGASGDSAATQLQADLQANGVELPTDIGTFPTFVPMLNIDLGDLNATVDEYNGGELTLTREMGDFEKGELGGFSVSGDFDVSDGVEHEHVSEHEHASEHVSEHGGMSEVA
jgi:hypothetical protein